MDNKAEICRTCLAKTDESIFQVIIDGDIEVPLIVMLSECVGIEVSEEDEISLNICDRCTDQIISCYEFRKKCLTSERKLRKDFHLNGRNESFDKSTLNTEFIDFDNVTFTDIVNDALDQDTEQNEMKDYDRFSRDSSEDPLDNFWAKENTTSTLPHECPTCTRRFKRHYNMKRHMLTHEPPKLANRDVDVSYVFLCDFCDHEFVSKEQLYQHVATHNCQNTSNGVTPSHSAVNPNINKEMPHECPKCSKCFKRRFNLKRHMETHEPLETRIIVKRKTRKAYVFICDHCGHKFGYKRHLQQHIRMHTGEKPFKCELCDYASGYYNALKLHKQSHSTDRPFKCKFCDKRFKTPTARTNHISIHSDDSPFPCDVCMKKFKNRDGLRRHRLYHHNLLNQLFCHYCDKKFMRKQNLEHHIRHVHEEVAT